MKNLNSGKEIMHLVTAIITTMGSDYVFKAIASVKKQTYKKIEIIVCYDGDDFNEFKKEIKNIYSDIILKDVGPFNNANNARQVGINIANGKYIALLDDDDYWDETHIEICIKEAEKTNLDLCFVCTGSKIIMNNRVKEKLPKSFIKDKSEIVNFLFEKNGFIQTSSFFMSKKLGELIKFDRNVKLHQDYNWLIDLSKINTNIGFKHIDSYTSNYLINFNPNSISKKSKLQDSYNWANSVFCDNNNMRVMFLKKVTCKFVKNSSYSDSLNFFKKIFKDSKINFNSKIYLTIISSLVLLKKYIMS